MATKAKKGKSKTGAKKHKTQEVVRKLGMIGSLQGTRFSGSGVGKELKFYDTALVNDQIAATGTWYASDTQARGLMCLGMVQGSGSSQRIGQKITIKSIQIRAHLGPNAATDPFGGVIHVMLVLDRDAKGANPSVTDLFTTNLLNDSMINIGYSERFRVMKKWAFNLGSTVVAGAAGIVGPDVNAALDYYHKEDIPIRYASNNGTIGDITGNNLFLVVGGYNGTTGGSAPQSVVGCRIRGAIRLRYEDC